MLPVLSGVPQGSILGPLLFLVFINDLPLFVKFSKIFLFVDDTKCHSRICDATDSAKLQDDLNVLCHLQLSTSYSLGDTLLASTSTHKDLGITVTSNLSWTAHYDVIHIEVLILYAVRSKTLAISQSMQRRSCIVYL